MGSTNTELFENIPDVTNDLNYNEVVLCHYGFLIGIVAIVKYLVAFKPQNWDWNRKQIDYNVVVVGTPVKKYAYCTENHSNIGKGVSKFTTYRCREEGAPDLIRCFHDLLFIFQFVLSIVWSIHCNMIIFGL